MKYLTLALGIGLLLTAGVLFSNHATTERAAESRAPRDAMENPPKAGLSTKRSPDSQTARDSKSARPRARRPASPQIDLEIALDEDGLTTSQIQSLSHRIPLLRQSALSKLATMTERYNLTEAQRHEMLPLLVESTAGHHPAMTVKVLRGGTWIPAPLSADRTSDAAIHGILDPEQRIKFEEAQLEEQAWWNEIVAELEEDFDSAISDPSLPADDPSTPISQTDNPAPTQSAPTPAQQGGNVFELLKK